MFDIFKDYMMTKGNKKLKTKKLDTRKLLTGGELCCNEGLNLIESIGFEVEFHNLIPVSLENKNGATEVNMLLLDKGDKLLDIDKNTKITIDDDVLTTYLGKKYIYSSYNDDDNIIYSFPSLNKFIKLLYPDCEFHSLYTKLRKHNKSINIIQLFLITLKKINWYLAQLEQKMLTHIKSQEEIDGIPVKKIRLYTDPKAKHSFIGLNDRGKVIVPQLTIGVKLENIYTVITAYLTKPRIKQLTKLLHDIDKKYKFIIEVYEYSQYPDIIAEQLNSNEINKSKNMMKKNPYTEEEIKGILFLLAIEMVNRTSSEYKNVPLLKYNKYTHIRLRYNIYEIINNRPTIELYYFKKILELYDDYRDIYTVMTDEYKEGGGGVIPDYDGNIVLLELRTFNAQLSSLIQLTKKDTNNNSSKNKDERNKTIDEYIEAIETFMRKKQMNQSQSKHASRIVTKKHFATTTVSIV